MPGFKLPDDLVARLIAKSDVLFISHRHGDHADKPVVAPPEVWAGERIHQQITHLKRKINLQQSLSVRDGKEKLEVIVFPGHQGKPVQNNVPLVITPEGFSVAHMGDQRNINDFKWIDQVGINYDVDVLLPNSWTHDIVRVVKGFEPELVITGHENEMDHTIDHREPYWMTDQRKKDSEYRGGKKHVGYNTPLLVMT